MQDILRIVVQVPPPPYEGEEVPPPSAPPVDWSTRSSLTLRDEGK